MTESLEKIIQLAKQRQREANNKKIGLKLLNIITYLGTLEVKNSGETKKNGSYEDKIFKMTYGRTDESHYSKQRNYEKITGESIIVFNGQTVYDETISYKHDSTERNSDSGSKYYSINKFIPGEWEDKFNKLYDKSEKTRLRQEGTKKKTDAQKKLTEDNTEIQRLKASYGL